MISFLLFNAGFLNLLFYVFAIGFVISLILEQFVKNTGTEEELLVFKPDAEEGDDDEGDLIIIRK